MRYAETKEMVRQQAIEWQRDYDNHNYSMSELAYFTNRFTELGKRYGLLTEFRENGII